ncbi:MAG: hypothetical protein DYG89_31960 [Caldilinea sp. CFX5]|nr:hypothetical protein [Caldilinea sp. CFX5]
MKATIIALLTTLPGATLILVVIYIFIATTLPPGGYFSGDQGVKYSQIDALACTHTLSVGTSAELLSVFRPAFDSFYLSVGKSYQAIFSPAYARIVLPFYLLFGMRGLVIPSILGTLLAAYGSGLLGKILGIAYPGVLVLVVGLASPLIFYAFILWEHALSIGLIVIATYLVLKSRPLAAGIIAAMAIWFRPEAMLFGPALVLAVLMTYGIVAGIRFGGQFASGLLLGIAPWWVYNVANFGTFVGPQVQANPITIESRIGIVAIHLLPLGYRKWAVLLITVLILFIVLQRLHRSTIFALSLLLYGVVIINFAHFALYSNGVAPSVTDVFPFAFASLISLAWLNKDIRVRLLWILMLGYLFGITLTTPTWGGGGWGPRMLLGAYPLLATLGWIGFETSKSSLLKWGCLALLLSSLLIQLLGLRHLAGMQKQWTQLNGELITLKPNAVATSVWWLPQVAVPVLRQMRWYGIVNPQDVEQLLPVEKCFWWIWTDENTSDSWEKTLHHHSTLPTPLVVRLEERNFSIRELKGALYCSIPQTKMGNSLR